MFNDNMLRVMGSFVVAAGSVFLLVVILDRAMLVWIYAVPVMVAWCLMICAANHPKAKQHMLWGPMLQGQWTLTETWRKAWTVPCVALALIASLGLLYFFMPDAGDALGALVVTAGGLLLSALLLLGFWRLWSETPPTPV